MNPSTRIPTRLTIVWVAALVFPSLFRTTEAAVIEQPYVFGTLAGNAGYGFADGQGSNARFYNPTGLARDQAGNIYVADHSSVVIRKISATGAVTTIAGRPYQLGYVDGPGVDARFDYPSAIAVAPDGTVYVSDTNNNVIRKITTANVVSTLRDNAGNPFQFGSSRGLAVDSNGNLFVAQAGSNTIWKIAPDGTAAVFAGGSSGSSDGTGTAAQFHHPSGLAIDKNNNVYVADADNNSVRKITPAAQVTTIAGFLGMKGSMDGPGLIATFNFPLGVAVDDAGNVFVSDNGNNTIRKITASGNVSTLAGTAGGIGASDGDGSAASFYSPYGIAADATGNLWVSDLGNNTIRAVTPAGHVTTFAGLARGPTNGHDGTGQNAQLTQPFGVAVDDWGNTYVADTTDDTIRKITPDGIVTTIAGAPVVAGTADGTGGDARFFHPEGITRDSQGNLFVTDTINNTIRKVAPTGAVTTIAGSPGNAGSDDGQGSGARFNNPMGIVVGSNGNLYIADTGSSTIRKISSDGAVTTLAGSAGTTGLADGIGASARFTNPWGITIDGAGTLYVADTNNSAIRKITPDGNVTTVVHSQNFCQWCDGPAAQADIDSPAGIAIDAQHNLYVTQLQEDAVRRISADGVVTTLGGGGSNDFADGLGRDAFFNEPIGIAADTMGTIYVADSNNESVRIGAPPNPSPSLMTLGFHNGHLAIAGHCPLGSSVIISASSSLTGTLEPIATVQPNAVGVYRFEDNDQPSPQARFYRATVQSP